MPRDTPLQTLLSVLEERGLPLGPDDVKWAFESPQTRDEIAAWVDRYLREETLLSFEEEALYRQLAPRWAKKEPALVQGSPLREDELAAAIEALEASTEAIERQCKNLETQKQALLAIKSQNREASSRSRSALEAGGKKNAQESGILQTTIEELSHTVNTSTETMRRQTVSALKSAHPIVQETLSADDRILAALAQMSGPEGNTIDEAVAEEHLASLISLRSAAVSAQIDYIYQHSLLESLSERDLPRPDQDLSISISELKEELGTLTAEIPSVVELYLNSTLRAPLSKALSESSRSRASNQGQTARYSLASLKYMAKRLDETRNHIQFLASITAALDALAAHIPPTPAPDRPHADSGPAAKAVTATGAAPPSAAEALLTHLGIKPERGDASKTMREIAAALAIRSRKIAAQAGAMDSGGLRMVAREVDREVENLERVLLEVWRGAGTEVGEGGSAAEDRLRRLEKHVETVGNRLREAETEEEWEGKKAGEVVEKWGEL